jgi:hypothetical protein
MAPLSTVYVPECSSIDSRSWVFPSHSSVFIFLGGAGLTKLPLRRFEFLKLPFEATPGNQSGALDGSQCQQHFFPFKIGELRVVGVPISLHLVEWCVPARPNPESQNATPPCCMKAMFPLERPMEPRRPIG